MVLDRWPDNFFAETEQVAFCPANIVPGIDFSNDPLLQGRLFSYLDTQLSRLGSPNFHQIPINAPKCPFGNHQRDGHMQMTQPKGRVAYEPNSLADTADDLPREAADGGFTSLRRPPRAARRAASAPRASPTTTARRGSSTAARPPPSRRTSPRRWCSSCRRWQHVHVREAMVGHLRNIDEDLAKRVAAGLALDPLPEAPPTAAAARRTCDPSPALQLIGKMKDTLEGRAGRHPGRRRLGRRRRRGARRRPPQRPAPRSRSWRPRSAARPWPTARSSRPTASWPARRRCSSTPWPWCFRPRAPPLLSGESAAMDFVARRLRPPQGHRRGRRRRDAADRRRRREGPRRGPGHRRRGLHRRGQDTAVGARAQGAHPGVSKARIL